ncbi:glycosyltransferase family 9 protein [Fusobacterium sp. PH5-44]|uniref:glycosyltransferase family 9 protein n=1 Tax=unclassified Fusobacterium TaxID=2648384 RepID=UPI003D23CA60
MKILVVRFKQIGDAILSAPVCSTLKKSFPEAQVDYVVYEHIAPLFENHKYIDNIISITKEEQKNIFKYIKKVKKITKNNYDIIIDIMSTPKSEVFTLLSQKSEYRIGRSKKWRGYTYTHKIEEPEGNLTKVEKLLKMLKPLENKTNIIYDKNFSTYITSEEKEYMKDKMIDAGIDFSRPIFACSVSSRVPDKIYPLEKMKFIIDNVIKETNAQIIFFYSPAEKDFVIKAHKFMKNEKNIFSNIVTKSIKELAMLISNCDMLFGNEGGPRHLAQSLNIPNFVIFRAPYKKIEWLPDENDFNQAVEANEFCDNITNFSAENIYSLIPPEFVLDKVLTMYDKIKSKTDAL